VLRFLAWSAVLAVGLLVFMLTLFDWNWVRPGIESYLSRTSQRRVHFDDLQVRFSKTLAPTVRLRGVEIENAPWAGPGPFARVGEVRFVFSTLRTLFDDLSVVSHLVLIDAEVDMERQADGLRNWRLRNPDYKGPGKYKVLRLEARNSRIRFVNREVDLEMEASSQGAPPEPEGTAGPPLPNRIRFSGRLKGTPFSGDLLTAWEMSLQETGEFFPLRGAGGADGARLELDGRIADFFRMGALQAYARISGNSLSGLSPFVRMKLPDTPGYQAAGYVQIDQSQYALKDFYGKLGASDLTGAASVSRNAPRPHWNAQLRSTQLRWADLRGLAVSSAPGQAAQGRVFSRQPWNLQRLNTDDAELRLEVARFSLPDMPALQSLSASARLRDGVLSVTPLDLGLAGGHLRGEVALDARQGPPALRVDLKGRGMRVEQLAARYPGANARGTLDLHAQLRARGVSPAALFGSLSGPLHVALSQGSISNLLDAKLGLNGGRVLWLKLAGDREIALRCGALDMNFSDGVGRAHSLVLDSEQTRVNGSATLDLRNERFEVLLRPQPKQGRVFALGSAIHASGSFRQAQYEIAKGDGAEVKVANSAACAAPAAPAQTARPSQPGPPPRVARPVEPRSAPPARSQPGARGIAGTPAPTAMVAAP
jgi:uncharacterized protein involved in outer membrane biogenesis